MWIQSMNSEPYYSFVDFVGQRRDKRKERANRDVVHLFRRDRLSNVSTVKTYGNAQAARLRRIDLDCGSKTRFQPFSKQLTVIPVL
jgi:hypothetical protein